MIKFTEFLLYNFTINIILKQYHFDSKAKK